MFSDDDLTSSFAYLAIDLDMVILVIDDSSRTFGVVMLAARLAISMDIRMDLDEQLLNLNRTCFEFCRTL